MKKAFGMIALLLAVAACNKAETDIPTEKPKTGATGKADGITITATLAPKSLGTKAVSEGPNTIVSTWAQDEKIAVLYEVGETKYEAKANVYAVDGETGAATISFTVESGTADNTSCTLVYPASAAKEDHTGVKETDWTAAMGQKPSATAFDGNGHESIAYTQSNFAAMQTAGIVILPAAGAFYSGGDPPHWYDVGITGFYWTSNTDESSGYSNNAYFVYFDQYDNPYKVNDSSWPKSGSRYYSVRLVQNK